jgi:hypothetical protein
LFLNRRIGVWRRRRKAASAAALYSVYHWLCSETAVSSVASAVALAKMGRFGEAVQYVQKAAKALYEAAKEVFEHVKITVQRLVELFIEAVARVLAWIDEHKAYLFLMAAAAAGVIALNVALNLWGLVELEKLAYAASLTPFISAGVKEYSREETFNMLKAPDSYEKFKIKGSDPYEKFKNIAKDANAGRVKLAEPWESLRVLIMPRQFEKERLRKGRLYNIFASDERKKKALFYAVLTLEEAFGIYKSALRKLEETFGVCGKDVEECEKVVRIVEVGERPFKKDVYVADLGKLAQLAKEEETAFEKALRVLRERLNEYAVMHGLGDLLNVEEGVARELAEAETVKLFRYSGVNFGTKAYAALIAYREYALGRGSAYGKAARHWLEEGGSAWLLYYAPKTAYDEAKKAKVERPVAVEELVAETLRRLFLKPGADRHSRFVELLGSGKLVLERGDESSYVFKLYRLEEGGDRLLDLGIKLWISKIEEEESITYILIFDVERWRDFFRPELEAAVKAAEVVRERLPVKDRLPYMGGWVDSDVAISEGRLEMGTSHLWQLAETHALFGWSIVGLRMSLTLEGPKLMVLAEAPLENLDEAVRTSTRDGWLRMLGTKAGLEDLMHVKSWDGLKRWVADHWNEVINAVKRQLEGVKAGSGFDLAGALGELKRLKNRLDDDKVAREIVAPALLLIQAERLGVNEETLRYFGAVVSGAIDGDGYVSAARREVGLASGEREIALLWAAVLVAYGIKAEVRRVGSASKVIVSGGDAARLAGLYFLYGAPLLEGDDRLKNHKLAEAVELAAEGLNIRWEGLREIKGGAAADLTMSAGGIAVKYNVYLHNRAIELQFYSSDQSRVELAARLLKLVGVDAEVKKKRKGKRDVWYVYAYTDKLAAGREELRKALAEIVREAVKSNWVDAGRSERWLKKLERGRVLMEGWPKYEVRLKEGALVIRFTSTNPDSIQREAQRLRNMGLKEDIHFTVKMPERGERGYVSILKEGLAYAAWLSVHDKDEEQRKLTAKFVELMLKRAEKAGKEIFKKVKEIIEEGKAWGSQTPENFEKKVEVNGKTYVVNVKGREAVEEDRGGKKLLRIKITAEVGRVEGEHIVDRVELEYTITYSRRGAVNRAVGYAYARGDAPEVREADAERLAAVIEALTGKKPKIRRMKNGQIIIECYREHLDGFMRYKELAGAIKKWLEETGRR